MATPMRAWWFCERKSVIPASSFSVVGAKSSSKAKVKRVSTWRREMKVCPPGPGELPSRPVRLRVEGFRRRLLVCSGGETA
jgi:hypothetical protein